MKRPSSSVLLALAGLICVLVIWYILWLFAVAEPQAYIIPLGLALLVLGWNARRRGQRGMFLAATLPGLLMLTCSALLQSLYGIDYADLLLVEGLGALAWGVFTRSRLYVQTGALALIANGLAQFGPALVELPRWAQLGLLGALVLGGGLAALFRREQILRARRAFADEWRQWQP